MFQVASVTSRQSVNDILFFSSVTFAPSIAVVVVQLRRSRKRDNHKRRSVGLVNIQQHGGVCLNVVDTIQSLGSPRDARESDAGLIRSNAWLRGAVKRDLHLVNLGCRNKTQR